MTLLFATLSYIFGRLLPPVFAPIQFSLIGGLLLEGWNIFFVAIFLVAVATVSYIPLWFLIGHFFHKLQNRDNTKSEEQGGEYIVDSRIAEKENIIYSIVKKTLSSAQYKKFATFMDSRQGKIYTFLIAIFLCAPIASDVIAVLLLRGKMSLRSFLLAGLIAKSIVILPLVFLGEGLISYFFS